MKKLTLLFTLSMLFFLGSATQAQIAKPLAPGSGDQIVLTCKMNGCQKGAPLFLYRFDGISFVMEQVAKIDDKNNFIFKVPVGEQKFYFVGANPQQTKPIILGQERDLVLQGNCGNIRKSGFSNSSLNAEYENAINQIRSYQRQGNMLNQQFQRANGNVEVQNQMVEKLKENDDAQMALLTSLKKNNPFVAKIVATKIYRSYQNTMSNAENELQYYLEETFAHLDLKDADLNNMPALYETFRDVSTMLANIKMDRQTSTSVMDNILAKMDDESYAYRYALGGTAQGFKSKQHPGFIDFGKKFIEKYGEDDSPYMANFKASVASAENFVVGAVAPDFEQNTPEDKPMKLSDLRGKVVLVDFWASWCGPCRRENPNVVRMYNQYKDKGFDVLGVSLDKTKDKWLKAIEKDNLPWHHVSDLRGWSNVVAKQYAVSSIPHTILLDREGKILARNLRGPQLEMKLQEIFEEGENN